jgi:WD40 repeat protein
MNSRMPFELTDAAIEQMLARRAGAGAESPPSLVAAITATVGRTPQRSRGLVPVLRLPRRDTDRLLLVAAVIALLAAAIGVVVIGGQLLRPPDRLVVAPVASPFASDLVALASASPTNPVPTPLPTPTPVPTPTPDASPSSSGKPAANGPLIVYAFQQDAISLFTLDPITGKRVSTGTLQKRSAFNGQSIHYSADRTHAVVFNDGDSAQAIVDVAARTVDALGIGPAVGRHVVAPDGERIADLQGDDQSGHTIVVSDLDGNQLESIPLPAIGSAEVRMWWSPDGASLLVNGCSPCDATAKAPSPASHFHYFIVPLDGGPIRPLLDTTWYLGDAAWSPDGSTIAFEYPTCDTGCADAAGIGLLDVATGVATRLTTGGDAAPRWSPAGDRIAFVRYGGGADGIYVMRADGTGMTRLTTSKPADAGGDRDVLWSPDGRSIVFSRGPVDPGLGDLYIVSTSGGAARLLVRNAVADW